MKVHINKTIMFDNKMYAAGDTLEMDESVAKRLEANGVVTPTVGETEAAKVAEVSQNPEHREIKPVKHKQKLETK